MCGIAGILSLRQQPPERNTLQRMSQAIAHRGPDADGEYLDPGVALGHRRLAIIDVSPAGNQPYTDASGRYKLVFNGELYNFRQVRDQIKDCDFRSSSDTEVLIESFARKGISCINDFKGMFAFAMWDTLKKELYLVRDRMGVKPLYYVNTGDFLLFSSEVRSILASGLVSPKINQASVADYLSNQSISSPNSLIEGIQQLEAGQFILAGKDKFEIKDFWQININANQVDLNDRKSVTRHIRELLLQSVQGRMISDVPFGAFLSGGIDSSAVVALMAEANAGPVNTFTVSFDEKEFDESAFARQVAAKFNTQHHEIRLKPTVMLEELETALSAMDSPSGDGINTYVVSKAVRNAGITVALSGIGGDELFAGYPFFKQFLKLNRYGKMWRKTAGIRQLAASMYEGSGGNRSKKLHALLSSSSASIEDIYPVMRNVMVPAQLRNLTLLEPPVQERLRQLMLDQGRSLRNAPLLSQVSIAEFLGYTQQTLLKDTDQMSMAVSLEVREPFFDHELVEFVLAVPDSIKFPEYPKQLLVESLGDLLPGEIVHRKKQGFTFPWRYWLRNELFEFTDKHISRMASRDFVRGKELVKMWRQFSKGDDRITWMQIWLFVVLEYWLEKNGLA